MTMNRYPSYKPTGVKWLGEIPSHWEMRKMKFAFDERSEKGYPFLPLLAATQNHGVIRKEEYENRTVEATKSLETLKLVDVGDFVISLRSFQGGIEISYDKGIISPAYTVLRPTHITGCYFKHLGKSPIFIQLLKSMVTGIREGQNIDYGKLRENLLPIPPIEEQFAIAAYLDTATAKIDAAIAQQQKMIDLLNERKQIIINRAVTKGLNPNAKMKDSGVEWIGEVPEGWEVRRIKSITSKVGSGVTPRGGGETYVDKGVMFLRSQNIYFEGFKLDDVAFITDAIDASMSNTRVKVGDVLFNITGGSIGRCYYVPEGFPKANVNQHVSIVRPYNFSTEYLYYLLRSHMSQIQVDLQQTGGNREGLTAFALKNFVFPIPPKTEQKMIIHYLNDVDMKLEQTIQNCQNQISLLQERKQIIINEMVTGKVRVV